MLFLNDQKLLVTDGQNFDLSNHSTNYKAGIADEKQAKHAKQAKQSKASNASKASKASSAC